VTVCIASLFQWNYGTTTNPPDLGPAAIVASDRMITFGDVQYEPNLLKVSFITPETLLLVAGDYAIHSQALKDTYRQISSSTPPRNIPEACA
jgi:hypothetical protein